MRGSQVGKGDTDECLNVRSVSANNLQAPHVTMDKAWQARAQAFGRQHSLVTWVCRGTGPGFIFRFAADPREAETRTT